MSLFEFLMILLSIIIGLGISELLSGFARILRRGQLPELCLAHAVLLLTLFIVLLQVFWESWSLNTLSRWTFSAMMLMLAAPVLLYLVAHIVTPETQDGRLDEHYFSNSRTIYTLLFFTALAGVLFKPLAFGWPLLTVDNLSTLPTMGLLVLLAWSRNPSLHRLVVPLCFVIVLLDTLAISYQIH